MLKTVQKKKQQSKSIIREDREDEEKQKIVDIDQTSETCKNKYQKSNM